MNILLANSFDSFLRLVGVLLIFIAVLVITYLTTRWMGGFQKAHSYNKNLQIVETIRVGNNKMISIIAVGTKYIVVSIGKDEVHFLTELTEEELKALPEQQDHTGNESFQNILNKVKNGFTKK